MKTTFLKVVVLSSLFFYGCVKNTQSFDEPVLGSQDLHSFSNFEDVSYSHLNLALKVDFESNTLTGQVTYPIAVKRGNVFVLDSRDLIISKVQVDKKDVTFKLGNTVNIFGQAVIIPVTKNSKEVVVWYKTKPESAALQWLKKEQTYDKTHPFLFSQSQAILARTWVPIQDAPAVKFTYTSTITVPEGMMALMSAENPTEKTTSGEYSFKMEQPISSYLLALAAGNIDFKSTGRNSGIYAEPGMLQKSVWEFDAMQAMIDSAESLYGAYVWGRYDVLVLPPSFPFGGMENPRLTFATPTIIAGDRSLVSLIAHELAHSWSGNLVTNKTWNDFWLNEGFTVYFEQRIMEKVYGTAYEQMLTKLGMEELKLTIDAFISENKPEETHLFLDLRDKDPDDGLTDVAYEKGRFFLQTIESIVGRTAFDVFLKKYFTENSFKTMDTKGFVTYLNKNLLTTDSLRAAVRTDEWIYGPGIPNNVPSINSTELQRIEAIAQSIIIDTVNFKFPDTKNFTTHHWLHLLRSMEGKINKKQLSKLDAVFHLSSSENAEIACDWFKLAIDNQYKEAYPFLEKYLKKVGRRKFLTPLYTRLAKQDRVWALAVYSQARQGYHSVSFNTIDKILDYKGN